MAQRFTKQRIYFKTNIEYDENMIAGAIPCVFCGDFDAHKIGGVPLVLLKFLK